MATPLSPHAFRPSRRKRIVLRKSNSKGTFVWCKSPFYYHRISLEIENKTEVFQPDRMAALDFSSQRSLSNLNDDICIFRLIEKIFTFSSNASRHDDNSKVRPNNARHDCNLDHSHTFLSAKHPDFRSAMKFLQCNGIGKALKKIEKMPNLEEWALRCTESKNCRAHLLLSVGMSRLQSRFLYLIRTKKKRQIQLFFEILISLLFPLNKQPTPASAKIRGSARDVEIHQHLSICEGA